MITIRFLCGHTQEVESPGVYDPAGAFSNSKYYGPTTGEIPYASNCPNCPETEQNFEPQTYENVV